MSHISRLLICSLVIFPVVFIHGVQACAADDPVAKALQQARGATTMQHEAQASESSPEATETGPTPADQTPSNLPDRAASGQENHADTPSPDAIGSGPEQTVYAGVVNGHLENGGSGKPTSSIYYPVFGNAAVDEEIKAFAEDVQSTWIAEIKEITEGAEDSPSTTGNWEQTGFFTLEKPNPNVVSITFNIYNYTGGAHGQVYIVVLNYDLNAGRRLELADIFGKPEKAIALMSEISAAQLRKTLGEDADDEMIADGTEARESNFANLSLLPTGITVEFQPYQVGPWSIGQQQIDIPLTELAPAEPNPLIWPDRQ